MDPGTKLTSPKTNLRSALSEEVHEDRPTQRTGGLENQLGTKSQRWNSKTRGSENLWK
jgi:hypothetical protein